MVNHILCFTFYIMARCLYFTYRFRYFGTSNYIDAISSNPKKAFCLASWHENTFAGILGQKGIPYCLLISPSKDGDFVDYVIRKLGYSSVRGSSSKGGKEARLKIENILRDGTPVAFTVDGPRGPRKKTKPGILQVSAKTRSVILPVSAICKKPYIFKKSWDQTKIPLPFSKIIYQFGPIIRVSDQLDSDEFEKELDHINRKLNDTESLAQLNLNSKEKGLKRMPLKKNT